MDININVTFDLEQLKETIETKLSLIFEKTDLDINESLISDLADVLKEEINRNKDIIIVQR